MSDETKPLPGHPLTLIFANSALKQNKTTPVSPICSEKPIDFIVNDTIHKQTNHLNVGVKTLKSFIIEQLYVTKNLIEELKD